MKHISVLQDSEPHRWMIKSIRAFGIRQLGDRYVEYMTTVTTLEAEQGHSLTAGWVEYSFTFRAPYKRGPAILRAALRELCGFTESPRKATTQQVRQLVMKMGELEIGA